MPNADLEPKSFELIIDEDGRLSARFSDDWTAAERQHFTENVLEAL